MDLPRNSGNRKGLVSDSLPDVVPQNADGTPVTQPSESSSESSTQTRTHTDPPFSTRREWRESRHEARFTPYRRHNALGKNSKATRSPKPIPLEDAGRKWRPLPVRGGIWLSHVVPKLGYPRRKCLPIAPRGFYWLTGTAATALVPLAPRHRYMRPQREVFEGDAAAAANFSEGEDLSSEDEDREEGLLFSREALQTHSEVSGARGRANRRIIDAALQDSPASGIISIVTTHSTKETTTNEDVFVPNEADVDPQEVIVRSEDVELPQHEITLQQNESFHSEEELITPLQEEPLDLSIKTK